MHGRIAKRKPLLSKKNTTAHLMGTQNSEAYWKNDNPEAYWKNDNSETYWKNVLWTD